MKFIVNPRVFQEYPGFTAAVIVAYDIDNSKKHAEVDSLLQSLQKQVKESLTVDRINKHTHIVPWRDAYAKFGAKPKKYLSSIENLTQRIVGGGTIKSVNTLVDLYNIISLKYLLPAGSEDLSTIHGPIQLTIAGDNEQAVYLLGDKEPHAPKVGEVFYKDDNGAICRRWNWKEAERTKVTPDTKNLFLVLEALPPVSKALLETAINDLGSLIEQYCGGSVAVAFVDAEHPTLEFEKGALSPAFAKPLIMPDIEKFSALTLAQEEPKAEHQSAEHQVRVEKVEALRAMGIEPWPGAKPVGNTTAQVFAEFEKAETGADYTLAGRLMSVREHGKTIFAHLQDQTGTVQLYIKKDDLGADQFDIFKKYVDIGDIVWVAGASFRTKMGEVTVHVKEYTLLSKCVHPLPEKFHGLTDIETKYRQRYLDLITNADSRQKFIFRSNIVKALRAFLDSNNFLEVETPMLHPIAGGAAARPFITHHNAFDTDFYLRIAPELYLKRLVVGGFERVYEINRNFRNEGVSTRHNPEFTMVEFYMAHHDYHFVMQFVEDLLRSVVKNAVKQLQVPFGSQTLDFGAPFKKLSIRDAVVEYSDITHADLEPATIDATMKRYNVKHANSKASLGEKIFALFEELVESQLIQPTFITDYPIEVSPLSKRDPHNPSVAARFELFIGGIEVSNGFNELNDPFDQAERFKQQLEAHKAGDAEAHQFDADYVQALEYALMPTVGVGIGIDRLVMLLTNTTSIKDVILFPTLKKK